MILYHVSSSGNRDSILESGLLTAMDSTGFGAVFLSNKRSDEISGMDCWAVECADLELEKDSTTDQDEVEFGKWFMAFSDVEASRLTIENKPACDSSFGM